MSVGTLAAVDDAAGRYRERPARVPGAVLWTRTIDSRSLGRPVLPDGCMDLIWCADRLLVAGPDTRARHPPPLPGVRYVGVRFAPGTAPALLGVPAHEVRDQRVDLADLWPSAAVRPLVERLAESPDQAAALDAVVLRRAAESASPDPLVLRVAAALAAGWPVAAVAEAAGVGARTLHRRCLTAFGYGPKTLARILRLHRALAAVRAGVPLAETAARAGFSDQAHLSRDVRALTGMPLRQLISDI